MKRWKVFFAVICLASAVRTQAIPFTGCTLWSPRLAAQSTECASFNIVPNGCTIVHCALFACIAYPGELFTGWMPDDFVEVTNRAGESAFASLDAPTYKAEMAAAAASWVLHGDPSRLSTKTTHGDAGEVNTSTEKSIWFGRALPTPYGPIGWSLASLAMTAGAPAPTCYTAISEFAAETWSDGPFSGDRALAALWAPIAGPGCALAAPLVGAISSVPIPGTSTPAASPCALPLTAPQQLALAVTAPGATNPLKQCMGALGGLLPRTGWTEGDPWTAAQRVAWRTASLAEDYFRTGLGVQSDDKWQLVWPITPMPRCFAPGSLTRPTTADPTSTLVRTIGYDSDIGPGVTEFLFAIWRKRTRCLEPWEAPAAAAEILTYPVVHAAACTPVNAVNVVSGGF